MRRGTRARMLWMAGSVLAALLALAGSGRAAPAREVSLWVARDAAPGPKIRLTLNTRNVPVLQLAAYRLEAARWLTARQRMESEPEEKRARPRAAGRPVKSWTVSLAPAGERPNPSQPDVYRSRQVNLPPLPPGVYLITAAGGDQSAWGVVNITHLAVVVKRSPRQLLAWVTDHRTGAPVSGATVALHGRDDRRVLSVTSAANGVAVAPTLPGQQQTVVVTRGGDAAGVPSAIDDADGILKLHFQTDRPIYRPGHTVHFKAVLRRTAGQGYVPVANAGCAVQVRDGKDTVLEDLALTTNSLGTLSGQVELPAEGMPGAYTVAITAGSDMAYGTFTVAEYRKPEFRVTLAPAQKRYLAGEAGAFEARASYFFGAPLPQARVTYTIRRSASPYAETSEELRWYAGGDGNLYPRDTYDAQPFVAEGEVFTDDTGRAVIPLTTQADAPDSVYTAEVTVTDPANRQGQAAASVPVYAAALRLGLSSDVSLAALGGLIPVRLRAADLDGRPVPARVSLRLLQPVWNEKEGRSVDREVAATTVGIPASGRADATLPARVMGDLKIVATAVDGTGRKARAELGVWVVGPDWKPRPAETEPTLSVRLDRKHYRPGEPAKAWISRNRRGRPALVTLEGGDLWAYTVMPAGRLGLMWTVRTDLRMSPNAYVSAAQWNGTQLLSDTTLLPLPDESRGLQVRIEPERSGYRPGEQAAYTVRTLDRAGKGTPAEVALSVVDEAVYAVRPDTTPNPFTFFWGLRENGVLTAFSAPEEVSGGAYQRSNALAPVRQRFLDTAFWSAHVQTGPDGTARVAFELPGNLTSWRATALAVTGDTRVGWATQHVQVSRPVMLRLSPPRLLVEGDRVALVGTVHNRTSQAREFEARLAASEARLEGDAVRRVRVPAGGEAAVEWRLLADRLPADGAAALEGEVVAVDASPSERADLSDRLRIPVRVVPRGVEERRAASAVVPGEGSLTLDLPADRIEPASRAMLTLRYGLNGVLQDAAQTVLTGNPGGTAGAVDRLLALSSVDRPDFRAVRDALSLLSRFQGSEGGWSWWEAEGGSVPSLTARVLAALAYARAARLRVPDSLVDRGLAGAAGLFARSSLWEDRALLAAALAVAGGNRGKEPLAETLRRGTHLSPYARLFLAEGLLAAGDRAGADRLATEVLKGVVEGPDRAFLPAGERPGWRATTVETTAQALQVLAMLDREAALQRRLAEWLARPEEGDWRSMDEQAAAARALRVYLQRHPDPSRPGPVALTVNGKPVPLAGEGSTRLAVPVPRTFLRDGANRVEVRRSGDGSMFVTLEARVFRPAMAEQATSMRVLRRFEVRTENGTWEALQGPIRPSDALRATVVVWPDSVGDPVRVVQPLPAGLEFVDTEPGIWSREEVRDGAIIHYLPGTDGPLSFRYFLRPETEGELIALPASGEALRRPSVRAHSAAQRVVVRTEEDARARR